MRAVPDVWRRGPARDAELFAFGRFNPTMVVEGKAVGLPAAWSQTLDKMGC